MRVLLAGLLLVPLGGCGGDQAQSASDCSAAIRSRDVVYVEAGFVRGPADMQGPAEYASCDDLGEDAQGVYFTDDATEVRAWSFEGHDPRTVLGVREQGQRFRVFVAEGEDASSVMRAVVRSLDDRES